MIIGTLIRNFKTYRGINYIPLTYGQNFCGLVGNNGIGKSSVLESLDCFFNSKIWNYNVITKKSGMVETRPHIVPIFLLKMDDISSDNIAVATKLSDYVWELEESDILTQNHPQYKIFREQLEILKREHTKETSLLIPLGVSFDGIPNLGLFNTRKLGESFVPSFDKTLKQIADEDLKQFEPLLLELKTLFEYIYIPKDIDPEIFTQLETKEIQSLMGETLNEIVEKCVPTGKISEINTSLNTFIDSLSSILES